MTDQAPAVDEFAVGEVRMARTFRIGPGGELFPVNSADAWRDGWNTAVCRRGLAHAAPAPDCRCGFYLYSDPAFVLAQPPGRQVLAVCSAGGVIETGTRGARAEQAKVDAVWVGRRVSPKLAAAVQARYPAVQLYRDRTTMDADFPLSELPDFRAPRVSGRARSQWRRVTWTYLAATGVLGCIPSHLVVSSWVGAAAWLAAVAAGFALMVTALVQRSPVIAFQGVSAIGWLVTADTVSLGQAATRVLFVIPIVWVAVIWWRAATPGRRVTPPRMYAAQRRWYRSAAPDE